MNSVTGYLYIPNQRSIYTCIYIFIYNTNTHMCVCVLYVFKVNGKLNRSEYTQYLLNSRVVTINNLSRRSTFLFQSFDTFFIVLVLFYEEICAVHRMCACGSHMHKSPYKSGLLYYMNILIQYTSIHTNTLVIALICSFMRTESSLSSRKK